jgi:hypothetical protein
VFVKQINSVETKLVCATSFVYPHGMKGKDY